MGRVRCAGVMVPAMSTSAESFVQKNGNKRMILLDGKFYTDKLIPVRDMMTREQTLYLIHDSQAMTAKSKTLRYWYIKLRNNALQRRGQWL
jgi:hypothetical protein